MSNNSKLASDVLQILPIMSELYELAESLKGKEITEDNKLQLQKLTRELHSKAAEVSLLPTIEDELRGIDMELIQDRFVGLVENVEKRLLRLTKVKEDE